MVLLIKEIEIELCSDVLTVATNTNADVVAFLNLRELALRDRGSVSSPGVGMNALHYDSPTSPHVLTVGS